MKTQYYIYKRDNGDRLVGTIIEGSLDCGDYGNCELIALRLPNGVVMNSIPKNKLEAISDETYSDYAELQYGVTI
tara:strand:+ start:619 stop:843 length:225 start_codon:yes stop_codon:yes gene_type:complete